MSLFFKKAVLALLLMVLLLPAAQAPANESAVAITAPDVVTKGTEVSIILKVRHSGNNLFHHTNWVYLSANGKELSRWEFSSFSLPEGENFSREFKLVVEEQVQLEAQSNCNLHGSAGKVMHTITLK